MAFLGGITCGLNFVIVLFFLRFYRKTHDRLFLFFAGAFATFVLNAIVFTCLQISAETNTALYAIRLTGFGLILIAIVDKNRRPRGPIPPSSRPHKP